ncbi:MAG: hypothetical protein IJT77_09390, partial [Clostridia bacterium]|nr:hypothetical protein [Clostridia bacterium]
ITKATYGQEAARAASAIYMLDVSKILPQDMIIKEDSLPGYQMWINPLTQQEVSLLPNATRLYRGAKLEYVSEILAGDVYGNGGQHEIDVITALNDHAFRKPVVSIGASGSLDFSSGVLVLPDLSVFELYQHEVSGSWLIGQMQSGLIRRMDADQTLIDAVVYGDGTKPANWSGTRIIDNITEGSKVNGLRCFWIGDTPEMAADDEQILVGVLLDEKNDEIKAFRTSRARIADGIANTDVSIYIFRDTNADRMGEEKYDAFFFDTQAGEASVIRVMTDVLTGQEIVVPKPIRIVLRGFSVNGADYPVYSLSDHLFAMCDGSDGSVKMFDNFYHATFNGDVFDSNYIRIEGIMNNDLSITIKKGQPVWSELKDASEMDESVDTIEM